jgi:hypothetical protein
MGPEALEGPAVNAVTCLLALLFAAAPDAAARANSAPPSAKVDRSKSTLIVVVGAAGEASYGKIFDEEVALWRKTAAAADIRLHVIGGDAVRSDAKDSDKSRLLSLIDQEGFDSPAPLWLVLIGHGTFDGRSATFNLVGPDLASDVLAQAFANVRRPIVVVNTTAASAPFLSSLSAPGRAVVTATKTGQERNYARFGRFFAHRVADPAADLDKDEQTSLFEAYLAAARDTAEFYKTEGRIATEHPLLDDDGDGRGVRADFFERGKLVKRPKGEAAADGDMARRLHLKESDADRNLTTAQREERNRLETELTALRRRKTDLPEAEYFAELEKLLVPLARLTTETTGRPTIGK